MEGWNLKAWQLGFRSLWSRRSLVLLIVLCLGLSAFSYLVLDRTQKSAEESFQRSISGTDLIVGGRSGPLQLLLYTVFGLGSPTALMSYKTFEAIASHSSVNWAVPISLGDSHLGYRAVATKREFFEFVRFGRAQTFAFREGQTFQDETGVVLGARVAERLGYKLGDAVILQHGVGGDSFFEHDDHQFQVVGILEETRSPWDQALFISLEAMELIHLGWEDGAPPFEAEVSVPDRLTPDYITAVFVGLRETHRARILSLQREFYDYEAEALTAILPGQVFRELWQVMEWVEQIFSFVLALVLVLCFVSPLTLLWVSLDFRLREFAVLRLLGAPPGFIFGLVLSEALMIGVGGLLVANALLLFLWPVWVHLAEGQYGLMLNFEFGGLADLRLSLVILVASGLGGVFPAARAYYRSLNSNLDLGDA
ncbi:MAG: ABC transporter permease [Bradymonadales bacterium]|nr:MAG: ABC transporter permease [Bradymonadales bacterium]